MEMEERQLEERQLLLSWDQHPDPCKVQGMLWASMIQCVFGIILIALSALIIDMDLVNFQDNTLVVLSDAEQLYASLWCGIISFLAGIAMVVVATQSHLKLTRKPKKKRKYALRKGQVAAFLTVTTMAALIPVIQSAIVVQQQRDPTVEAKVCPIIQTDPDTCVKWSEKRSVYVGVLIASILELFFCVILIFARCQGICTYRRRDKVLGLNYRTPYIIGSPAFPPAYSRRMSWPPGSQLGPSMMPSGSFPRMTKPIHEDFPLWIQQTSTMPPAVNRGTSSRTYDNVTVINDMPPAKATDDARYRFMPSNSRYGTSHFNPDQHGQRSTMDRFTTLNKPNPHLTGQRYAPSIIKV